MSQQRLRYHPTGCMVCSGDYVQPTQGCGGFLLMLCVPHGNEWHEFAMESEEFVKYVKAKATTNWLATQKDVTIDQIIDSGKKGHEASKKMFYLTKKWIEDQRTKWLEENPEGESDQP